MVVLTPNSYIRNLPHSSFMKLSSLLDPEAFWEKMAVKIPLRLSEIDDENAEPRYSHQQIAVFAYQGQRAGSGNSPTQRVLKEWWTQNSRICDLIKVLLRAELYTAANYLNDNVLKLGPAYEVKATEDDQHACDNRVPPSGFMPEKKDRKTAIEQDELGQAEERRAVPGNIALALPDSNNLPESSSGVDVMCDYLTYMSNHIDSVLAEQGRTPSFSNSESSTTEKDPPEFATGLDDIAVQVISYQMLGCVTDNFNEKSLEEGGNVIGSGGFGRVYLGKFHNGFKVAVKSLVQTEQMKQEDLIKQFENEVRTLSKYRHTNIVHLLGYSIDGPTQCLVYQYMINGSLEDRLAQHQGTEPLSADLRVSILKDTGCGIEYLNDHGHVHRDIKSANILLDSQFTAKVGDFATVVSAPSGDSKTMAKASVVIGTPAYLAPEAISFDISTKLDSYSFGVILLEVITGLPAQDKAREEPGLSSHIMENVVTPSEIHDFVDPSAGPWKEGTIDKLYDISMRCLQHLKRDRPNVKDILPEIETL